MKFTEFLIRHGYSVLFLWVLAEQMGLPLPAIPVLLAAGALAGAGKLSIGLALVLALVAALVADSVWYQLGRRRGAKVLNFLCRMSLEPDTCVRKTENSFAKHGARSLLLAKFVPGLSTIAPPLAGMFRLSALKFVLYDAVGALLWAGAYAGLGFMFSDQLERVGESIERFGSWLVALLAVALAGYILYKYVNRRLYIRQLRVARISPEELKQRMEQGEPLLILDLRHGVDVEAEAKTLPGAFVVSPEDLEEQHNNIPRDRDIILYCS